jgi:hypothetical protein
MHSENFKASVQYGDWKGTSASDNSDNQRINDWLIQNGHKDEGEFLVGIEMYAGNIKDSVSVKFLLITVDGFDNVEAKIASSTDPVEVKRVTVDMPIMDFLAFFKRFSISFSSHGIFDNVLYTPIEAE